MRAEIIAEIGVNHLGSTKLATKMIDAGISVGLKLFKFQIFNIEELGVTEDWEWYDYMNHCALSRMQHFVLKDYCDERGVTYFASVFGDWSLDVAKEMDMEIYKLASRSVYTPDGQISPLATKVLNLDKRVIASSGYMQEGWPIPQNCDFLYCVSKYPTTRDDITWPDFRRGPMIGFSDHTIGIDVAEEAITHGAQIIEKHYTIDKTLYGPDQKGSATPDEMQRICEYMARTYL